MFWEVTSAALRMIAWLVILGAIAPRVLFRNDAQDGPAAVARMVVLSALTAGLLWLFKQLSVGSFFAGLGVYGLGTYVRGRRHVVRTFARALWGQFADLFFLPSAVRMDVAADSGKPVAEMRALLASEDAKPMSWARRTRRVVSGSAQVALRGLGSAQLHVSQRTEGFSPGFGRAVRRRAPAVAAHCLAIVGAISALWLRLRGGSVLSQEEVERVRAVAGWRDTTGVWLPDLVTTRLLSELTLTPLAITAVALGGPLILLSGWSGQQALRRLAPGAPPWLGALACGAAPWAAVAQGQTIGLYLALIAVTPWLLVGVGLSASRARRRSWVALASCILHPLAGVLGVAALISSYTSERSERVPRDEKALAYLVLGLLGVAGSVLAVQGGLASIQSRFVPHDATFPPWLAYVSGATALWLVLGARAGRAQSVLLWGRAAGLLLMATLFVSGAITGTAYFSLPLWCVEAQALMATAIVIADVFRRLAHHPVRFVPLLGLPLLASAALEKPAQRAEGGLSREVLELSARLRKKHLDWNFSLVASAVVLPAFAEVAWPVPGQTVQIAFPAKTYRYDALNPQFMIGTTVSYIVFSGDNSDEEVAMRRWLEELVRLESYPAPQRVPALSVSELEVYKMVRKPELEQIWNQATNTKE